MAGNNTSTPAASARVQLGDLITAMREMEQASVGALLTRMKKFIIFDVSRNAVDDPEVQEAQIVLLASRLIDRPLDSMKVTLLAQTTKLVVRSQEHLRFLVDWFDGIRTSITDDQEFHKATQSQVYRYFLQQLLEAMDELSNAIESAKAALDQAPDWSYDKRMEEMNATSQLVIDDSSSFASTSPPPSRCSADVGPALPQDTVKPNVDRTRRPPQAKHSVSSPRALPEGQNISRDDSFRAGENPKVVGEATVLPTPETTPGGVSASTNLVVPRRKINTAIRIAQESVTG
ncbi:hypothetical protein B0A48_18562 [Cryoendolithus antarcticus]|uniref:Uncharacterized protein n=1 Tax=Cryoendolithus antarcticus TaxID=1507870 RepID=A0A1V8S7W2_9PEZI|nr:hypothetical protein B0A48_18562 [Cryoendolithus antarcticus]